MLTMNIQTCSRALLTMALLGVSSLAAAQSKACIELKTTAETEQEYLNEQGQKSTRLVAVDKAVPGSEVIWTVTAKNICSTAADNIVISNPVPEHMEYLAGSAMGVGTEITYSTDGREFKPDAALVTRTADGTLRTARANEYRHIRWTYKTAFAPGATAFTRYRAIVK